MYSDVDCAQCEPGKTPKWITLTISASGTAMSCESFGPYKVTQEISFSNVKVHLKQSDQQGPCVWTAFEDGHSFGTVKGWLSPPNFFCSGSPDAEGVIDEVTVGVRLLGGFDPQILLQTIFLSPSSNLGFGISLAANHLTPVEERIEGTCMGVDEYTVTEENCSGGCSFFPGFRFGVEEGIQL